MRIPANRPVVIVVLPDGSTSRTPFFASEHADEFHACAQRLAARGIYASAERHGSSFTGYTGSDLYRMKVAKRSARHA